MNTSETNITPIRVAIEVGADEALEKMLYKWKEQYTPDPLEGVFISRTSLETLLRVSSEKNENALDIAVQNKNSKALEIIINFINLNKIVCKDKI